MAQFQGPVFQTADGSLTFREIGEMISRIWNNAYTGIPMYGSGSDTDDVSYPNVVWKCAGKWPLEQRKPKLIEEYFTYEDGNARPIAKSRMKFRGILEIKISSTDAQQANMIIEQFELFMFEFIGAVKKAGAAEIVYAERAEDNIDIPAKSGIVNRTLRYEVHEELIFIASDKIIEAISIELSTEVNGNTNTLVEEITSILQ